MIELKESEFFQDSANKAFKAVKDKISKIVPNLDLRLVGGVAVPGALTKGEVDVLVRIKKDNFQEIVSLLTDIEDFRPNHKELWSSDFLVLKDMSFSPPVDILICAIGSESDTHHKRTELLRKDKGLLREYNEIKLKFCGQEKKKYRAAKDKLYDKLHVLSQGICSKD